MARCKSWRFIATPSDPAAYLPVGRDHKVWRPCRNRVEAGARRCQDCENALITCPNAAVRRALASEPNQSAYVLESLMTDNDITVAAMAHRQMTGTKGLWAEQVAQPPAQAGRSSADALDDLGSSTDEADALDLFAEVTRG